MKTQLTAKLHSLICSHSLNFHGLVSLVQLLYKWCNDFPMAVPNHNANSRFVVCTRKCSIVIWLFEFNQIIPFARIALINTMLWLNLIKSSGTTKIRCNILLRRRVNFSWTTVHVNMNLSPPPFFFFVCVENLLVYYVYSWVKQIQNSFGHVNKVLLNEDRSNRHSDNAPHKTQTARDCLPAIAFASLQSHIVWICKTQVSKLQLFALGWYLKIIDSWTLSKKILESTSIPRTKR